jgi:hypothetical protein
MPAPTSNIPPYSSVATPVGVVPETQSKPMCWGAVIAGAVVALSVHLLVTLFGIGLGLQVIDPISDAEPAKGFGIGVGIAWSVGALLALWVGGWVAGRLTPEPSRGLGGLHGAVVWSLATVVAAFMLVGGSGMLVGGLAKVTGQGVAMVGEAGGAIAGEAADGAGDFVSQVVEENSDLLGDFARELAPAEADGQGNENSPDTARRQREVSWALVRFFSQGEADREGEARQALERTIAENSDLNEAEARERVQRWINTYDQVKKDLTMLADRAEQEAREAAEAASGVVTQMAVWTFVAFLVGAISAICGGVSGARCRRAHDPEIASRV